MVVQGRQKRRSNWYTMVHNSTHFFCRATNGRSLCTHSATTAMCVPSSCLLWAICERRSPRRPLCDCFEHAQTSRRPWRPWRYLNVLCTTLERPRQPFGLLSAFNGYLAIFVVAQGRHKGRSPCRKGVLGVIMQPQMILPPDYEL